MKIIDNFLTRERLEYIQELCNKSPNEITHIPEDTIPEILQQIPLKCKSSTIYRINDREMNDPHIDKDEFSVILYPFDSDGCLALYRDGLFMHALSITENKLVLFECYEIWHKQVPPYHGDRICVVYKFHL